MSDLLISFSQFIEAIQEKFQSINIAYSGGVDSTVLLHLAVHYSNKHNVKIKATHINHHLSPNADKWAEHCLSTCKELDIDISIIDVDVTPFLSKGLEAAAREARYNALIANALNDEAILLGQHLDDQAETFFLQLSRGAGPQGLSAMPSKKCKSGIWFYRPLLTATRKQIIAFANANGVNWVEDESNASEQFDRNYLRHNVMPSLLKKWPKFSQQVSKSASLCADESRVVEDYMQSLEDTLTDQSARIYVERLGAIKRASQSAFIRHWLKQNGVNSPNGKVIAEILSFVTSEKDKNPEITIGQQIVYRYQARIAIRHVNDEHLPFCHILKTSQLPFYNDDFELKIIDDRANTLSKETTFEVPVQGELKVERGGLISYRFKPYANRPQKALKEWCKEWRVPPFKRQNIIKILCDNQLVAIYADKLILDQSLLNQAEPGLLRIALTLSPKQQ